MAKDLELPLEAQLFPKMLRDLHAERKSRVVASHGRKINRAILKKSERDIILSKTAGRCHICGGEIEGGEWQADHVLAHSAGGQHLVENYLAAHSICNNYRWHYDAEEFQWILKLGVWLRTQMEKETAVGKIAVEKFYQHEHRRVGRSGSSRK